MTLHGLPLEEAARMLAEAGKPYSVVRYASKKPYADADSERVVRANIGADGVYELVVCGFVTAVKKASQD